MDWPCRNCNDRFVGCHSNCDRYAQYRSDLNDRNNLIKAKKQVRKNLTNAMYDSINKNNKNKSRKYYGGFNG